VGDGIQNSRKNGEYARLLMGGASLGWKSTSPILGFSGNVYSAAIIYGEAQLGLKRKGNCDLPVSGFGCKMGIFKLAMPFVKTP